MFPCKWYMFEYGDIVSFADTSQKTSRLIKGHSIKIVRTCLIHNTTQKQCLF